jgi:hypothetical protein
MLLMSMFPNHLELLRKMVPSLNLESRTKLRGKRPLKLKLLPLTFEL